MRPNILKVNNRTVPKASPLGTILYQDDTDERLYYKDRNGNVVGIAISADVEGSNELSEVLSNGNTTGGTNISMSSTDSIEWNLGSGGILKTATTTALRSWTLPDNGGTLALLSDVQAADALDEVLGNGNTTGTNDIIVNNGQKIKTANSTEADRIEIIFTSTGIGVDSLAIQRNTALTTGQLNISDAEGALAFRTGAGVATQFSITDGTATLSKAGATAILRFVNTNNGNLQSAALGADRTWTLPDQDGTVAMTSDIQNISNTDLTVSATGTRKLIMAGTAATDVVSFRDNADALGILEIKGNNQVNIHKALVLNATRTNTGGALDIYAGNSADYITEWYNSTGTRIMDVRTATDGAQIQVRDSSSTVSLTISGQSSDALTFADAKDMAFGTTTGTMIATTTSQKIAFYGSTPVVQPTAISADVGTITFVDENTPDYALSSLTTTSPAGFATLDEAQGFVEAVARMQTRIDELENTLQSLGLLA